MKTIPQRTLSLITLSLLYGFLYLPLLMIIMGSFNQSRYGSTWQGWTWHWYHEMLRDPALLTSLLHSLSIALITALISTALGSSVAFTLCHYRARGHRSAYKLLLYMMLAPDLLIALGLLMGYHILHWPLGFTSLCLAHIALCFPLAALLNLQRCQNISPALLMAAKDLDANDMQLFTAIVLPLLRPSLIASFLLCFMVSFDDTILSYFLTGPDFQTLPVYLFGQIKLGLTPTIHAISTTILALSITVVLVANPAKEARHVA